MTQEAFKSKDDILKAFKALLRAHENQAGQIATKAEEAAKAQEREVVDKAAGYTVESIVKGLADLQLSFSAELDRLSETLESESSKLSELQRAIVVEAARLKDLQNTKVAAEALAILKHENAETMADFEKDAAEKRTDLDENIESTRKSWAEEAEEFTASVAAYDENLTKDRAQAEADYQYDKERKEKIEADQYTEKKRLLERNLAETEAQKEKDWSAREKVLTENAEEIAELRAKVEAFPTELEEAVTKAREGGIRSATNDAKVDAELLEKEIEGNIKVYELRISSLESTITEQNAQIAKLLEQLNTASVQSQDLAVKAIEGASRGQA